MTAPLLTDPRWLHNPSRLLYGALVTGSVIAVAGETSDSVKQIVIDVVVVLVVYWASHVYSEVLTDRLHDPDAILRERLQHGLRHEMAIVFGGTPALVVLATCGLLGIEAGRATDVALLSTVVLLGCAGYAIGRVSGASRWGVVAEVAGAVAMGVLIVLLKAFALH